MNTFFGLVLMIAMITFVVFFILFMIKRSKDRDKAKRYLIYTGISFVLMIVGMIGASSTDTPENHMTSKQIREASIKKKQEKEDNDYAKAQKKKAKQEDLANLRKDLAQVPAQTKNTITDVELSSDGSITATLNDDVLAGNSAQIKNIAKTAADSLSKLVDRNYPLPSPYDEADLGVKIVDSSGNTLYQQSTNPF